MLFRSNVLKEILALLVNQQASLWYAAQAVALLIPFVLVFALPMGMLTANLLVFGRFSADQELTAVRAGGISLLALVTPILLFSVGLSCVSAAINLYVAPQCRVAYKRLLSSVGMDRVMMALPEKTFIKDFSGYIVYLGKVRGPELQDILIYKLDKQSKVDSYIRASEGRIRIEGPVIHVQLMDAWRVALVDGKQAPFYSGEASFPFTNEVRATKSDRVQITDMTFFELRDQLMEIERQLGGAVPLAQLPTGQKRVRADELTLPIKVQMHRQVAFSFAAIGFTLVGIPLGIRAHRRETTFGIAIALLLVAAYYSFFILGESLDARPECVPHLILWAPNFLFQAIGMVLLWRANKGI